MRNLKGFLVSLIATGLGAGFSPKAPGTAGTVVGVLLAYGLRDTNRPVFFGTFALLLAAGWWATWEWSRNTGQKDSQRVVIDEVLGYLLAVSLLSPTPALLWIQFGFFRFFDVLKPPPIRQIDRYGKRFEIGALQSLFVILDDLMAGVFALLLGLGIERAFFH